MDYSHLVKQLAKSNPLRSAPMTRRDALKGIGATAAATGMASMLPGMARAAERELTMLTWDGYVDNRVLDTFTERHKINVKYELHTSDPDSVNKLRAGQTKIWDIINLNNPWAREIMWPEKLIVELPRDRFEPYFEKMLPMFKPPYKWAMSLDEQHLLGQMHAVRVVEVPDPQRLIQLAGQLENAEADRVALLAVERMLVDRIGQHLQRLELIERQIDGLEAPEENEGTLTGAWDLVLMPARQRGTALLRQTGALVNGTYRLEGGWSGSLQGTLVNRKVFLVRIDSKLGKSMELEGYLSDDGKRIRGTWLDYELAGGDGATGQWTALRQTDSD